MADCKHERVEPVDPAETTREVRPGYFQTTRIRQNQCQDCRKIFNNQIDIDMAASNRTDGYYGVIYEQL